MCFAWACGILGRSVCSIVSWIVVISRHPLKVESDYLSLKLCGALEDPVHDGLADLFLGL